MTPVGVDGGFAKIVIKLIKGDIDHID